MTPLNALHGLMALIDDGILVRNTSQDSDFMSFFESSVRLTKALAAAQKMIDEHALENSLDTPPRIDESGATHDDMHNDDTAPRNTL